jgi:hypothetical protein
VVLVALQEQLGNQVDLANLGWVVLVVPEMAGNREILDQGEAAEEEEEVEDLLLTQDSVAMPVTLVGPVEPVVHPLDQDCLGRHFLVNREILDQQDQQVLLDYLEIL